MMRRVKSMYLAPWRSFLRSAQLQGLNVLLHPPEVDRRLSATHRLPSLPGKENEHATQKQRDVVRQEAGASAAERRLQKQASGPEEERCREKKRQSASFDEPAQESQAPYGSLFHAEIETAGRGTPQAVSISAWKRLP